MPEQGPEFNISLANKDKQTEVRVTSALSQEQVDDIRSTMEEMVENKSMPWVAVPLQIVQYAKEDKTSTTLVFKNANHFGVFRNIYGENCARIVQGILELDGHSVDLDERVQDIPPTEEDLS